MLQITDGQRRLPCVLHAVVFGLLVVAAVATSTLRQRAHSQDGPDEVRIANKKDTALSAVRFPGDGAERRPSVDLSYIPEVKQGLVAIRPKAVFARADMQPVTALFDAAIRRKLAELGIDEDAAFSIAEVEQVLGPVVVEVLDPNGAPGERGRLMMGLSAVRSEKRLPVKEVLEATHAGATTTKEGSATIIETPEVAIPAFGPIRHFAMPDEHTLLPGISGQALTSLADRPASEQVSAKPWFDLWGAVEQDMFAIVLDNSNGDWNAPWHDADYAEAKTLAANAKFCAIGCDLQGDKLNARVIVECKNAAAAEVVVDSLKGLLHRTIREVERQPSASQAAVGVNSIRVPVKNTANESLDTDYFRRLYISALQSLAESKPAVDAGRVSLQASVDVDVSTVASLAAALAGDFGASAPTADASSK
jgi:hypothetical protein